MEFVEVGMGLVEGFKTEHNTLNIPSWKFINFHASCKGSAFHEILFLLKLGRSRAIIGFHPNIPARVSSSSVFLQCENNIWLHLNTAREKHELPMSNL